MSQRQARSLPPPASSLLPVDNNILYGHLYHDTILRVHPVIHEHLSDRKQNYVRSSSPSDAARDAQTESGFPVDENVLPHYLPALQLNESEDWQHTTSDVIPSRHI